MIRGHKVTRSGIEKIRGFACAASIKTVAGCTFFRVELFAQGQHLIGGSHDCGRSQRHRYGAFLHGLPESCFDADYEHHKQDDQPCPRIRHSTLWREEFPAEFGRIQEARCYPTGGYVCKNLRLLIMDKPFMIMTKPEAFILFMAEIYCFLNNSQGIFGYCYPLY